LSAAVAFLSEHSVKVVLLLLLLGGLVWLTTVAELKLPVRVIKIESGSDEESKFLLMVPSRQRVRLPESQWAFCRANLAIQTR
jgi:hypothetical protein